MLTNPRTLFLTILAVLVVGCSESPVTNVSRPTAPPTAALDADAPTGRSDLESTGFQDVRMDLPAADLPRSNVSSGENVSSRESVLSRKPERSAREPAAGRARMSLAGTPVRLPGLPGMSHPLEGLPPADRPPSANLGSLPGLPGSDHRLPRAPSGLAEDEASLPPGLQPLGAGPVATLDD